MPTMHTISLFISKFWANFDLAIHNEWHFFILKSNENVFGMFEYFGGLFGFCFGYTTVSNVYCVNLREKN